MIAKIAKGRQPPGTDHEMRLSHRRSMHTVQIMSVFYPVAR